MSDLSPTKVRAAHLLIKHTGSRNPVSRRTGSAVTLSPDAAMQELREYESKIHHACGAQDLSTVFRSFAEHRSDCSSYQNGGDLGEFSRGMMQKPFEDAAFALQPGQMSGIVNSDSGYHLIYRIS